MGTLSTNSALARLRVDLEKAKIGLKGQPASLPLETEKVAPLPPPPPDKSADVQIKTAPRPQKPWEAEYRARADELHVIVRERFPFAFGKPVPLKIGINSDLNAAVGNERFHPGVVGYYLRGWCTSAGYLKNSVEGAPRIDLDGEPAGIVTADEATCANARLADKLTRKAKRANVK